MSAANSTALDQEIVIDAASASGQTGAQSVAPDHSPRADHGTAASSMAAHAPVLIAPPTAAQGDLQREVEQFLYHQSELLDTKHWQQYIELFADDGIYWMPVTPEQTSWEGEPSIFAEDKPMMEVRMGRVTHPNAWSQAPMWATSHVVGNVVIESQSGDEIRSRARFHMTELRRDEIRHFAGTYRHILVRGADGLRIRRQKVDLINAQAPFEYVLQIWV